MNTIDRSSPTSSKIGAFFSNIWQVSRSESKLVLINAGILFCIVFNYTILRNLKDTLINTAASSGPEVTCFIKSWLVLPLSIGCFVCITKLSNIFSRENIFYISTTFFLAFFCLFCFVLYPNKEIIHPSVEFITSLQQRYPSFQWIFPIYGVWSYILFYIFAELWGSVMMSLLFWEYVNEVTKTEEAKRFYPLFILLSNIGLIAAGIFVSGLLSDNSIDLVGGDVDYWYIYLQRITWTIMIMGIASMFLYKWSNQIVDKKLRDSCGQDNLSYNKKKPHKLKLNLSQSLKCIFSSSYLGLIAVLVISYGAAINLIEVVWKKQLAMYFNSPTDYLAFMSKFSVCTGVATIVTILLTKKLIQYSSWIVAAIFTPLMLALTGGIFFLALFYKNYSVGVEVVAGAGLTLIIIWIGAIQNILSKSSKYALFDPSKEITYIPLDNELKMKGKAAVDVVGERLGKASGGYIQQILLMVTGGSILSLTPILFILIFTILTGWIAAVFKLNEKYNALTKTKEEYGYKVSSEAF